MSLRFVATRPTALIPIAMSLAALGLLALALTFGIGRSPDGDEGAAAHIWQILVAGQVPIVGWFLARWLPRAPRQALVVVSAQALAGLAALAPVFLLRL